MQCSKTKPQLALQIAETPQPSNRAIAAKVMLQQAIICNLILEGLLDCSKGSLANLNLNNRQRCPDELSSGHLQTLDQTFQLVCS